tara:strand:+ start:146 stop:904 length:759 start_codon:yes stop_codon:yes gene_type:complete
MIDETKIMQLADGTLPLEEREEVKKAIEADPKLKELYNSYQETGDLLFKLGNEIKSQPLPNSLKEKLKVLNETQEKVIKIKKPFAFFNIFKVQYAGIAAALALFFYGGFYTQGVMMAKKDTGITGGKTEMQMAAKKEENKLKPLGQSKNDLSSSVSNVYKFFNEEQFVSDVSGIIDDLKEGDEFELSLKDGAGTLIKFILVKSYQSNNGLECKNIAFKGKTKLSRSDLGTNIELDLCKRNNKYQLVSINISK